MRVVDRMLEARVLACFKRVPTTCFRVVSLLFSCLRYAVLYHSVAGAGPLAQEVREAGKLPVIKALAKLGWKTLVPVRHDLGNGITICDRAEGVKGDAVAVVTVGRPSSIIRKRLLALAAILDKSREYLISVDPVMGNVSAYVFSSTPAQKSEILEYLRQRARIVVHYISTNSLPNPDSGPWCAKCPYYQLCRALEVVGRG